MHQLNQKINWRAIIGQVGLLLHVPAGMATLTLLICVIFQEWFALAPLAIVAVFSLALGQTMYHAAERAKAAHLWDAMLIAGVGWLFCSIISAIPIYWIASRVLSLGVTSEVLQIFANPVNALFESFSGLTSTGLTMKQGGGPFPYVLQFWRSLLEWVGGLGLVVFILALTHLNKEGFQLYYAEARSEQMTKNITGTAHWIWGIYLTFTAIAFLLFLLVGMPLWEAINHAMTAISTGGFTIRENHFHHYSLPIQAIAVFIMIIGAISFAVHYRVIRERAFDVLWKSMQHRLLYLFAILGGILIILLNLWNHLEGYYIESFFQWISALTTCGFSAMNLSLFSPMVKVFLMMGMFVGGATGSTAGGIKIRRFLYLVSGVTLRIFAISSKQEKHITEEYTKHQKIEPPGIELAKNAQAERLFTANILFALWTSTLFLGWFLILKWTPKRHALDALFEVTSAMSNVGLSTGIINPNLGAPAKWIFMFLMWIGRLEIIPALILLLTLPLIFTRRKLDGKQP